MYLQPVVRDYNGGYHPIYLLITHGLSASYELHITSKFALPILHVQKLPYKV